MAQPGVTAAQIIGWTVTSVGIVVSLGWNFYNQRRTTSTAAALRAEQYRSAQWTRIRDRIEEALDDLVDTSKVIVHQMQQIDDANPGSASILLLFNQMMVDAQDKLAAALEEADASEYCDGQGWCALANGVANGTETSWDNVLRLVAEAEAAADRADKIATLQRLRVPISQIRAAVTSRCRTQDISLDPEKL